MGKKSKAPAAPDYTALAEKTAQQNRPSQNTAMGSSTWTKDAAGNPVQTQTLNPAEQARLDQQRDIYGGLLDQAQNSMANPLDTSGMTQMNPNQLDPGFGAVQQVKDDYLSLMQHQMEAEQSRMESQLKQRGIPMNSPAWMNAMRMLEDSKARRGWEATDKATRAYGDIFNRGLAGNIQANNSRLQQLNEATALRELPMNEYKNYGGQVSGQLLMPSFMPGTDYAGAGGQQYQAQMDQYNANQARSGGLLKGLMGIGGTILGGPLGGALGSALGGAFGGTGASTGSSSFAGGLVNRMGW